MLELRRDAGFVEEALRRVRQMGDPLPEELHGHIPIELRVATAIDGSHGPSAENAHERVAAQRIGHRLAFRIRRRVERGRGIIRECGGGRVGIGGHVSCSRSARVRNRDSAGPSSGPMLWPSPESAIFGARA